MDTHKDLKTGSKGWTTKNIGRGLLFIGIGLISIFLATFIGLTGIDSGKIPPPIYINIIDVVALIFSAFGIFGFWFVITAFQKWRNTKKEWVAWMFLVIAIVVIGFLIYFRNIPL